MSHKPDWIRGSAVFIGWAAVTAVAATGSWLGLSTVFTGDNTVTSADAVMAGEGQPSPSITSSSPKSSPADSGHDKPKNTQPAPKPEPSSETQDAPSPDPKPINGWQPIGNETYEQTFDTEGGTAVVQLSSSSATYVSASPADGYTVATQQPSDTELRVVFYDGSDSVTIASLWENGEPNAHVLTS